MTNLEWIKSLDKKEIEERVKTFQICDCCVFDTGNCDNRCREGIVKWLREEHPEALRPCPECGGKTALKRAIIVGASKERCYYVMCQGCATTSWFYPSAEEAIEAWNRREK